MEVPSLPVGRAWREEALSGRWAQEQRQVSHQVGLWLLHFSPLCFSDFGTEEIAHSVSCPWPAALLLRSASRRPLHAPYYPSPLHSLNPYPAFLPPFSLPPPPSFLGPRPRPKFPVPCRPASALPALTCARRCPGVRCPRYLLGPAGFRVVVSLLGDGSPLDPSLGLGPSGPRDRAAPGWEGRRRWRQRGGTRAGTSPCLRALLRRCRGHREGRHGSQTPGLQHQPLTGQELSLRGVRPPPFFCP